MPTQWQERYTELENINHGYEFENGDTATAEHINVTIENVAYLKRIVDLGTKNAITDVACGFDFAYWESHDTSYIVGEQAYNISLTTANENNQVMILPVDSNVSIAEAKVEYVSGDNGYIEYRLKPISSGNTSYIEFAAYPILEQISGLTKVGGTLRQTNFRVYVKDVYGNEFSKTFTINYKSLH